MLNKLLLIISFIFFFSESFANSFTFKTKNLEIIDKSNMIIAGEGIVFSNDRDMEISANEFIYLKEKDFLESKGNGLLNMKNKNLMIYFDKANFDQKKNIAEIFGNVKIKDITNNIVISGEYFLLNNNKNLISSNKKVLVYDNFGNNYLTDSFLFEVNKNILKFDNLTIIDPSNNRFNTKIAFLNTKTKKIFGKDIEINLNNSSFGKDNEPRLKGRLMIKDGDISTINKGVFTTCKRTEDSCPPWQIKAKSIQHDKKNKIITYEKAFLEVYDLPVMYFPKFFHPDPSVKRKSGFLVPGIKSASSTGDFLNVPYYLVIADNKDATFSPRLAKDKFLIQTEYRQLNKESSYFADFSYYMENNKNPKNHFFLDYQKKFNYSKFQENNLNLVLQNVSHDTYLKANNLQSDVINIDNNNLENSLELDFYSDNISLNINSTIYEDLNQNNNDRYEYILPQIKLIKNFENLDYLNGNLTLQSEAVNRNFNTNVYERFILNDILFSSYPEIKTNGLLNNFEMLVKNVNLNNRNSNYKNKETMNLSGMFQFNTTMPLVKQTEKFTKLLKPKVSLRLSPFSTTDIRNNENKIDVNNIFSLNRINSKLNTEEGASIIIANEYSLVNSDTSNEIINFKIANNLRINKNDDLPNTNQIGEKTSSIFNEIKYSPNDFFSLNYSSSIRNDFKSINYESFSNQFSINNFVTTFEYLNENNTSSKNSFLSNSTTYNLNKSNKLLFKTRKNKTQDLTEYYNLMYEYKNDCLAASIEYNKDFYNDRELQPNESVFFKIKIIPFSEASTPNLKN